MREGLPLPQVLNRGGQRTGSSVDHRAWLRRIAMLIIWVLITVEVFLSPRGNIDYDSRHGENGTKHLSDDICNKRGGASHWQAMKAAQWLVIGAPLLWMATTAFLATGFGVPGLATSRLVRGVRSVWHLDVAWLSMLILWCLLAYFTVFRNEINEPVADLDSDNEWGFGQNLALVTWIPVVLKFISCLLYTI
ncbi:hypothetical protein IMZ48_21300, partial [Candidatus Bathyarchaeota archaeon]|nr:hypothetical protein [Candidatus Bathyarchaeota archaeon]